MRARGEAARIVAEEGQPGKVEVLDSQTGAGGLGCLVIVAATVADAGGALDAAWSRARGPQEP